MVLIIKMLGWLTATVRFCLFFFFTQVDCDLEGESRKGRVTLGGRGTRGGWVKR